VRGRIFTLATALSLLLCLATAVLWVRSYWFGFGVNWIHPVNSPSASGRDVEWYVAFGGGRVYVERYFIPFALPAERLGFGFVENRSPLSQDYFDIIESPTRSEILFPIALPFALTLILPLWNVYSRLPKPIRPSSTSCPTCSYNLTGNTSGVCPECGTAINSKDVPIKIA
jgi:hypothetical protein